MEITVDQQDDIEHKLDAAIANLTVITNCYETLHKETLGILAYEARTRLEEISDIMSPKREMEVKKNGESS